MRYREMAVDALRAIVNLEVALSGPQSRYSDLLPRLKEAANIMASVAWQVENEDDDV